MSSRSEHWGWLGYHSAGDVIIITEVLESASVCWDLDSALCCVSAPILISVVFHTERSLISEFPLRLQMAMAVNNRSVTRDLHAHPPVWPTGLRT